MTDGTDMTNRKLPDQADLTERLQSNPLQRKPYRAPVLTVYGHISKLTLGVGGSGGDKTMKRATCL